MKLVLSIIRMFILLAVVACMLLAIHNGNWPEAIFWLMMMVILLVIDTSYRDRK